MLGGQKRKHYSATAASSFSLTQHLANLRLLSEVETKVMFFKKQTDQKACLCGPSELSHATANFVQCLSRESCQGEVVVVALVSPGSPSSGGATKTGSAGAVGLPAPVRVLELHIYCWQLGVGLRAVGTQHC